MEEGTGLPPPSSPIPLAPDGERPPWVAQDTPRLGRYLVGPLLGKGGMGKVHEAFDTLLNRRVALKLLTVQDASKLVRFIQEAQIQGRIDHPNICKVFDVDATGETPKIAMQLVLGGTLESLSDQLTAPELVEIMAQVAEGIQAAHDLKLIHRDLKPSNVLLEIPPSGQWTPRVCDFGLAKDLQGEPLTLTESTFGTPQFMAPEQISRDLGQVGVATDVYGLGATLYATLTGQPPFTSSSVAEVHQCQVENRLVRPRALRPSLSKDLETILLKCLELHPQDRYPSAQAVADDLRRFLRHEPLQAHPVGPLGRSRRWVQRHPALFAFIAAAGLLIAGLLAWNVRTSLRSRRRERAAEKLLAEVKDFEQLWRLERMMPAHDLRPGLAQMRARMDSLRVEIAAMGPDAEGPGHYALGRGYLALGEPADALRAFERAWSAGYQTPDVAYALGKAHCLVFWDEASEAGFRGDEAGVAASRDRHLPQAKAYFDRAQGQSFDPPALAKAFMDRIRGKTAEALLETKSASASSPWDFESIESEVSALARLGFDRQVVGDYAGAQEYYGQASEKARLAQDLGRSDPASYQSDINWRLAWAASTLEQGRTDSRFLDDLDQECDRLLSLNPDAPEAQANKLTVQVIRAEADMNLGHDPSALLNTAMKQYEPHPNGARPSVNGRVTWMELHRLRAQWLMDHGGSPEVDIQIALRDGGHSDYRLHDSWAETMLLKAKWELRQGVNPEPTLEATEIATRAQFKRRVVHGYFDAALAEASFIRAQWQRQHGVDPSAAIQKATDELEAALEANARVVYPYLVQAELQLGTAEDLSQPHNTRRGALAVARKAIEAGLIVKPGYAPLLDLRPQTGRSAMR